MHIKFLSHGTGDPKRAADYLTGPLDHNRVRRAVVRVLRGDPQMVARLAGSLEIVQRYTSGVISWHLEDEPTDEEIDALLVDFERVAFAGLQPHQYIWSAILHVDHDGSRHVHVYSARVELTTGKSFNMAPPGWARSFDPLRDMWNHERGWARPDDPTRARLVQPGPMALASRSAAQRAQIELDQLVAQGMDAAELREALDIEPDSKRLLADWLVRRVHAGLINSRQDLVAALGEVGDVNRVSEDFISVRLSPGTRPLRLRGELFAATFDAAAVRRALTTMPVQAPPGNGRADPNPDAAAAARIDYEKAIGRRTVYNQMRYPVHAPAAKETAEAVRASEGVAAVEEHQAVRELMQAIKARPEPQAAGSRTRIEEECHDRAGDDAAAAVRKIVERVRTAARLASAAVERVRAAALAAVKAGRGLVVASYAVDRARRRLVQATERRTMTLLTDVKRAP